MKAKIMGYIGRKLLPISKEDLRVDPAVFNMSLNELLGETSLAQSNESSQNSDNDNKSESQSPSNSPESPDAEVMSDSKCCVLQ